MSHGVLLELVGRFGLDVVCLLVMAGTLYRRRPRSFSKYAAMGSRLEPGISENSVPLVGVQLHRQGAF